MANKIWILTGNEEELPKIFICACTTADIAKQEAAMFILETWPDTVPPTLRWQQVDRLESDWTCFFREIMDEPWVFTIHETELIGS